MLPYLVVRVLRGIFEFGSCILAFLSSAVCNYILQILNPTLNYQAGNIKSLPIITKNKDSVDALSATNIKLAKADWDSFETSWDFKKHPLI